MLRVWMCVGLLASGVMADAARATVLEPRHAVSPAANASAALRDIDTIVAASMAKFSSPGMAVAVVKDGRVLLAKGYGLRNVEDRLPVTPDTLFPVGSITKGFTTALAAMLVDEGKLDFNEPVRTYLPSFALKDSAASEQITLRDMFTHMSGLPSNDTLRFVVPMPRAELVHRLRYLTPNTGFRQLRQYNNLMYVAGGVVEETVTGRDWEQLLHDRLLAPLHMDASNTSVRTSLDSGNFAYGYAPGAHPGQFVRLDLYDYQKFGTGPNGAVNSNLTDLLKYLAFQLGDGRVGERQLVSAKQMKYIHSPLAITGGDKYGDLYGLGWFLRDYGGYRLLSHPGGIVGFHSFIGFIPELNFGFIVFSNQESSEATRSVAYSITDRVLGLPRTDWVARLAVPPPEGSDTSLSKPVVPPAHPLEAYVGTYENPAYGRIEVAPKDGGLTLAFPVATGVVKPRAYDTFDTVFKVGVDVATARTEFHSDSAGHIDRVRLDLDFGESPGAQPIEFVKVAAAANGYAITDRIPGPDGGWDYAAYDSEKGRLYVSRTDGVMAVDVSTKTVTPQFIPGGKARSVVLIPGGPLALATFAGDQTAVIFDTQQRKRIAKLAMPGVPDGAVLDPASGDVYVMNKNGKVAIVATGTRKVKGQFDVGGELEAAALDGQGRLFVNVSDHPSIAVVDLATRRVTHHWKLEGCKEPTGLAYFAQERVLVSACDNSMAKIVNADSGAELASIPIGKGPDAVIVDSSRHVALIPSQEGATLAVIDPSDPAHALRATVKTELGAGTGAIDPQSGRLFLPSANFVLDPPPEQRSDHVRGTFHVLVMDRVSQ